MAGCDALLHTVRSFDILNHRRTTSTDTLSHTSSNEQLKLLKDLIVLFTEFETATEVLSGETFSTISLIAVMKAEVCLSLIFSYPTFVSL